MDDIHQQDAPSEASHSLTAVLRGPAAAQTLALLQDTLDAMKDAVALWDEELKLVLYNARFVEMVLPEGFRPLRVGEEGVAFARELFRSGAYVMSGGMGPDDLAAHLGEIVRDYAMDLELERTNGQVLGAASKRTALGGYLLTVYDKTDTKRAEAAEARRLEAVNDAVEALEEGFSLWDADMNFLLCNDRYMEIVFPPGFPRIEPGANAVDVVPKFFEGDRLVVPEGVPEEVLVQDVIHWITSFGAARDFYFRDGRVMRAAPHQTKLGGYLITVMDVTAERNAEAKRLEAVNDAVGALDEGFVLLDHDLNFTLCNPRFMELTYPPGHPPLAPGTPAREAMFQLFDTGALELGDVSREAFAEQTVQWVKELRGPREYHFKNGRVTRTRITKTALGGYLALITDITEERNTEQKARDMLFDAFQTLDEGLVLCDSEMRFVFGNDAWHRMMFDRPDRVPPKPGESALDNLVAQVESGFYDIPEGMSGADYIAWMMGEMSEHGKQVPYRSADGRHFIGSSHQTSYGGALMFIRDITRQKQAEEALAQQREIAHQNEKLSALGELLAGVAHELNNPLSVVFGYSQMLQGKVADPKLAERIDLICQSAERAAKIVKTFLAMARQRPTKIETCSINDIVATALEVSSYSLKSNGTEVLTHFDETAPPIDGDFDQLAQVFSNLIINAGHAVEPQREAGQIVVKSFHDAERGETVVEIRDNGPGIPKDIQSRIFEPFFTTKEVGEGTGVGLAFSHRIIRSHDGALDLVSAPGRGTRFFVRLKASVPALQPADAPRDAPLTLAGRRVLVLDDEEGVAQLVADLLTDAGLNVTKTTAPRAALRLMAAHPFDAVLSDFKMPDMDGRAFYEAARIIAPGMGRRIGFMTGDAMSAHVAGFFEATGCLHIEKPIVTSELMALLAQISAPSETAK